MISFFFTLLTHGNTALPSHINIVCLINKANINICIFDFVHAEMRQINSFMSNLLNSFKVQIY